jgi:glycerol-3-phosphate dehydrogenase
MTTADILIIGGGINGVGIAADAAGRGLKVILCEQNDLASATSSASSKMIHGGLRYLENYEFRLVREALKEREILLKKAPHLIAPLRLYMPYLPSLRPYWMIRLGLFFYDHLNLKQSLPKCDSIRFNPASPHEPLKAGIKKGFAYSDAWVDDARLVIANAQHAQTLGANILPRHQVISAHRVNDHWQVEVKNTLNGLISKLSVKAIVNASGPWVDQVLKNVLKLPSQHHVRLVKGSHIVVPKLYQGDQAYILQHTDKRVIFVFPYRRDFSLIGTTDVNYEGSPEKASISPEEIDYLCEVINHYFKKTISAKDYVWSYSGVRPLQSDDHANPSKVTRDYTFEINDQAGQLPVLSVFGGKLTTYRRLAESALEKLAPYFPNMKAPWTANSPLPGGGIDQFEHLHQTLNQRYPWADAILIERLAHAYGTLTDKVLGDAKGYSDLGQHFGGSLYEKEVEYLLEHEWAHTAEDILWRRSKQGLVFSDAQIEALEAWLKQKTHARIA